MIVNFQDRLPQDSQRVSLPIPVAENVKYQTALAAIEGHGELDIQIDAGAARPVDIGKLAAADYRVGRRLLGSVEFLGPPQPIQLSVYRRPGYGLTPVIVQRAELVTQIGTHGNSQTAARYRLRTKASFLEVQLPQSATLWSMRVDGESAKPQKQGDSLLVSLPADEALLDRDLQIVYAMPIRSTHGYGAFATAGPQLFLRDDDGSRAGQIPVADLQWHFELPAGYAMVNQQGTVANQTLQRLPFPLFNAFPNLSVARARTSARVAATQALADVEDMPFADDGLAQVEGLMMEAPANEPSSAFERAEEESDDLFAPPPAPLAAAERSDGLKDNRQWLKAETFEQLNAPSSGKAKKASSDWAMEGVGSLRIDVDGGTTSNRITLTSLGATPIVRATIIDTRRQYLLGIAGVILVLTLGLLMTKTTFGKQMLFAFCILFLANLIPTLAAMEHALSLPCAMICGAVFVLIAYFIMVAIIRWTMQTANAVRGDIRVAGLLILPLTAAAAIGQERPVPDMPAAIDWQKLSTLLDDQREIRVPESAVIVPYQADDGAMSFREAEKLLVPYQTYVKLWNQAYPSDPIDRPQGAAEYALAGATYSVRLEGEQSLTLEGELIVETFSDQTITVPLPVAGVVFAQAMLDDKPARLRIVGAQPMEVTQAVQPQANAVAQNQAAQALSDVAGSIAALEVQGKGRHTLRFVLRMGLERTGGWRLAAGQIPAAAATRIDLTIPDAATEVRLSGVHGRRSFETEKPEASQSVALAADGKVSFQWRPRVALGQVDESLTVESDALIDLREEGPQVIWNMSLEFPRSRRGSFTFGDRR
ncbi:MAG: hypothetical protein R3C05_06230 [Pirellulaceae bacterium]